VSSTSPETGVAYEYRCRQPAAPARDRGHELAQARAHSQRSYIYSCKRLAAFLKRSPETATREDLRLFQLHLAETGMSVCNRMTGVRFLFRVTLRRLDLVAEIYHLREPQKILLVMSPDETKRLLAVASSLKARILLGLGYGCGLRVSEVVRLKVKHIDSAQNIIRIEQSKGRKDRNVMLSPARVVTPRSAAARAASSSARSAYVIFAHLRRLIRSDIRVGYRESTVGRKPAAPIGAASASGPAKIAKRRGARSRGRGGSSQRLPQNRDDMHPARDREFSRR
jgi:integrase